MRAIIFANGKIENYLPISNLISDADYFIGADGGTKHLIHLGRRPNVIIGDLDSIKENELTDFINNGVPIIKHNPEKDQSDLELAIYHGINHGCDEFLIFGGLGNRWDHSIGNILLPLHSELFNIKISFWENNQYIYYIKRDLKLSVDIDTIVSLFPLSPCKNITTNGLKYPLNQEEISIGSTRGLSNIAIKNSIQITLEGGVLLCIINHRNPK